MARGDGKGRGGAGAAGKRRIAAYAHGGERANNPPVGLVTPANDPDTGAVQRYAYDPHFDPSLQWAGKAERLSFEVPVRSLHVHERIDPRTIIQAIKKPNGTNGSGVTPPLFESERAAPLRDAIEFYQHKNNWTNRMVAGDSLLVMNSLLQKENMAGRVQCVYMDPPYGIKYGSNFQPFVGKREVKDGKDEDLTAEPEMIRAFRDTWELGIHSYLSYMRDRLRLARDLLADSGSCFVQISDENVHHIREIMDEIFGAKNFISLIPFRTKTGRLGAKHIDNVFDFLVWYARDINQMKHREIFEEKDVSGDSIWGFVEINSEKRRMTKEEINNHNLLPQGSKIFRLRSLAPVGYNANATFSVTHNGKTYGPPGPKGRQSWATNKEGVEKLIKAGRIWEAKNHLEYIYFLDDFRYTTITNNWNNTRGATDKKYVVQTDTEIIQRCMLMTTDPGDLVFDPTCGSGTTAFVAEQWGRRWITCDTSRVALTLARQRLMTATFDYYKLANERDGVSGGFEYKTVPHITLKSIANNEPPQTETLFDRPLTDKKKVRITGPFTVEAVPAPGVATPAKSVRPIGAVTDDDAPPLPADASVVRSGETFRQSEWRDELLKSGIRGKSGQRIAFSRVEAVPYQWLHAEAETRAAASGKDSAAAKPHKPRRVVVSFGPEHAPLEQRQVENALLDAEKLRPKPEIVVFAAFQFDPEAAKDIDETDWPGVTILKAQMNADLQTHDLKKKRVSDDSFWLVGQPDVRLEQIRRGDCFGQWIVQVYGFDYFNTRTGVLESGDEGKIAVWMLDTDYDGRALYPRQVFFPMSADKDEGWRKLAKTLRAEIDGDLVEAYTGAVSLPFEIGKNRRIAVKIVDDRGIESLKIINM